MARIKRHHGDRLLIATLVVGVLLLIVGAFLPYIMNIYTGTSAFTTIYGCAKCAPGTVCPDYCIAMPPQYAATIIAMSLLREILLLAALLLISLSVAVKMAAHFKK